MSIRITLTDGTRTQVAAEDIRSVEADGRGSIVHLASGETLSVVQDSRTVDLRIQVALAAAIPTPVADPAPVPVPTPAPVPKAESDPAPIAEPQPRESRLKRILLSRSSLSALFLGGIRKV